MARSLNIVIGADIEKLQKGFNDAISVVQSSGKKMSESAAETAKSIQDRLASIATKNPTAGTVRQLTNLAMEARALGPEFTNVANEIIQQAGRIKDSIGDARAEVSYFASDTRRLDAVLGGIEGIAGAFSAVEGGAALLGIESEDLQKTMAKLQGAIALVNGVQAVQNALQAESAVRIGITTAATQVQAFVMGQATIAARVYSAALVATGAGAVIVAIGLVISLFQKSGKAIDEAKEKLAALEKQQERGLTLGQRRIKEEERALELAISRAEAEGKSEAYIYNLKKASLEKQKGIYQQYGKEALALLDRQRNAELYTVEANSKEAAAIRTKYEQLADDLRYSINEEYQSKVAALQMDGNKIAQNIRENNLKQHKDNLKKQEEADKEAMQRRLEIFALDRAGISREIKLPTIKPISGPITSTSKEMDAETRALKMAALERENAQLEYEERMTASMERVNQAFNSLAADGVMALGEAIGDILSGGQNSFQEFGKKMLEAVAQFMRAFGSALITTAIASKTFKEFILRKPEVAIAAGIALVAGSAAITGMLKRGPKATEFADGGIVSGPTLGLVGEYPGARSNPEVIAPLDKLKGMLNTGNNNSGYIASTTIQGRDLAIVLERYNKDSKRG
jgi:hypothetical protein